MDFSVLRTCHVLGLLLGPLGRGEGFHRQGVQFVGGDLVIHDGVDGPLALHAALAFEVPRDDRGKPMAAIALDLDVLARQTCQRSAL